MKREKITVDFMRVGKTLLAKLVELPPELSGEGIIISDGTYDITSVAHTEITDERLYLGGTCANNEGFVVYRFKNVCTAKKSLKHFKRLINIYNVALASDGATAWERAE